MNIYNCVVVDDELYAIEGLKNYIETIPNLRLAKYYTNPVQALMEISNGEMVDLILLDINMPQINGLELAREIRLKTRKLVFTTSYAHHAYDSYEVEGDAYLLKPYTLSKFAAVIARLFPLQIKTLAIEEPEDDFFFVKDKNDHLKIIKIRYRDVIAVESQQNYVFIHTVHKKVLTYMSLSEIAKAFRSLRNFVQFQRSFILNKEHIESIDGNMIKMVNGIQITVGEYYRKNYQDFLTKNLVKARRKE